MEHSAHQMEFNCACLNAIDTRAFRAYAACARSIKQVNFCWKSTSHCKWFCPVPVRAGSVAEDSTGGGRVPCPSGKYCQRCVPSRVQFAHRKRPRHGGLFNSCVRLAGLITLWVRGAAGKFCGHRGHADKPGTSRPCLRRASRAGLRRLRRLPQCQQRARHWFARSMRC